jgi:hypothetical protein
VTVGESCYAVDSEHLIRFLANCPHRYRNTGTEMAVATMLISYLA